jgi:hypothetical protein
MTAFLTFSFFRYVFPNVSQITVMLLFWQGIVFAGLFAYVWRKTRE